MFGTKNIKNQIQKKKISYPKKTITHHISEKYGQSPPPLDDYADGKK